MLMVLGSLLTSIAFFFVSAKAHGRQLRLEREFEGHYSVQFRGGNHPWVTALWRAERWRFWCLLAACEIVFLLFALRHAFSWNLLVVSMGWIPSFVFSVTGALSLWRLMMAIRGRMKSAASQTQALRPDWAVSAILTSAMWWTLVLICVFIVGVLAKIQR